MPHQQRSDTADAGTSSTRGRDFMFSKTKGREGDPQRPCRPSHCHEAALLACLKAGGVSHYFIECPEKCYYNLLLYTSSGSDLFCSFISIRVRDQLVPWLKMFITVCPHPDMRQSDPKHAPSPHDMWLDQGWAPDPRVTQLLVICWWRPMTGVACPKRWARVSKSFQGNLELQMARLVHLATDTEVGNVGVECGPWCVPVRSPYYSEVKSGKTKWRARFREHADQEATERGAELLTACLFLWVLVTLGFLAVGFCDLAWVGFFFATKRASSKTEAVSLKHLLKSQALEATSILICPPPTWGIPHL